MQEGRREVGGVCYQVVAGTIKGCTAYGLLHASVDILKAYVIFRSRADVASMPVEVCWREEQLD